MTSTLHTPILMTVPIGYGVGSHVVSHALCESLKSAGEAVVLLSPFVDGGLCEEGVDTALETGHFQGVLDRVCALVSEAKKEGKLVILEGVSPAKERLSASFINEKVAKALAAEVLFITCPTSEMRLEASYEHSLAQALYLEGSSARSLGLLVNKFGKSPLTGSEQVEKPSSLASSDVLAVMPWHEALFSFHLEDLAAKIPLQGETKLLIKSFELIGKQPQGGLEDRYHLYIVEASNSEAVASVQGKPCVLVVGGSEKEHALTTSAPLATVMFSVGELVSTPPLETDPQALAKKAHLLVPFIKADEILKRYKAGLKEQDTSALTPTQFRYFLKSRAAQGKKRLVLPESNDERVLRAAHLIAEEGMAEPLLVGALEEVNKRCKALNIPVFSPEQVLDPQDKLEGLVAPLVELRKHKGLDEAGAKKALQSPIVLATMLLKTGEVDGLIAGASTSTADTIRPAFQLIKTATKGGIVSSLFFICFPQKVVIFADCAVNIDPSSEELAAIAIETGKTACRFGFDPKVAMLSYSTLDSGKGTSVDKVKEAVALIKSQDPDLAVEGPLQFDAAFDETVAAKKAPDSLVAGQANVYIFPTLDAGNIAYKAATKASNVLAVGPVLQGLTQPVNDLSRGASVDDIVYTAAITAISS